MKITSCTQNINTFFGSRRMRTRHEIDFRLKIITQDAGEGASRFSLNSDCFVLILLLKKNSECSCDCQAHVFFEYITAQLIILLPADHEQT